MHLSYHSNELLGVFRAVPAWFARWEVCYGEGVHRVVWCRQRSKERPERDRRSAGPGGQGNGRRTEAANGNRTWPSTKPPATTHKPGTLAPLASY